MVRPVPNPGALEAVVGCSSVPANAFALLADVLASVSENFPGFDSFCFVV